MTLTLKPRPDYGLDCLKCAIFARQRMGGAPREQKVLKGHLPRVIYQQVYYYTKINEVPFWQAAGEDAGEAGHLSSEHATT